jgi:rare lipoprotein A
MAQHFAACADALVRLDMRTGGDLLQEHGDGLGTALALERQRAGWFVAHAFCSLGGVAVFDAPLSPELVFRAAGRPAFRETFGRNPYRKNNMLQKQPFSNSSMEKPMAFQQKENARNLILTFVLTLVLAAVPASAVLAQDSDASAGDKSAAEPAQPKPEKKPLDRSGKPRHGKASYYARSFAGKKMADGTPMNPEANIAASRTLPLGTKAEVTNLENGKSEVVEIRDRGPYVDGRIVDVSPKVADKLEIRKQGVAPVVVTPIEVPQSDGGGRTESSAKK